MVAHKYWFLVTMATHKQTAHHGVILVIQKQAGPPSYKHSVTLIKGTGRNHPILHG